MAGNPSRGSLNPGALSRALATLSLLAGLGALGAVLYLQFAEAVQPCSLCIYQRLADLLMMIAILLGFFILRRWLWSLASLSALSGAALAGWQWHLANAAADRVQACATIQLWPSQDFSTGSLSGGLTAALAGHGSCAIAGQQKLAHWPITHWSVAFFLGCALLLIVAVLTQKRRR